MKMVMKYGLFATTALSLYVSSQAIAGTVTLGLGGVVAESVFKGEDTEETIFPVIAYESGDFSIDPEGAAYRLMGSEDSAYSLFAGLGISGDSYSSSDADVLKGMSRRHDGVDLGVGLEFGIGPGSVAASISQDISGNHKGQQAELSYEITMPINQYLVVQPSAALSWQSKDYVDYYYGVRANEATVSRAVYKGDSTVNSSVGLGLIIPINKQWRIVNQLGYTWLGDGITDSPLVGRDEAWNAVIMTTYTF
jgi:outer membrane protein